MELAGDDERGLLADVDRVVADALDAPRDDDHPHAPLLVLGRARRTRDLVDDAAVRPVDQLVEVDERPRPLDVALGERVERDAAPSPRRGRPSPGAPRRGRGAARAPCESFVSFAIVTDWSPTRSRWIESWRIASTSRRSVATGDCWARSSSTDFSIAVVAGVDLVVEADHLVAELDVRASSASIAPRTARSTTSPCSCEARLERVELRLELDPGHRSASTRTVR